MILQNSLGLDKDKEYACEYLEKHLMLQEIYSDLRNNMGFIEKDIVEYKGYPNAHVVFVCSNDYYIKIVEIEALAEEIGTTLYALLVTNDLSSEQFVKELDIIKPELIIGLDLKNVEKHEVFGIKLTDGTFVTFINTFDYLPISNIKTKKEAFNRSIMAADIRLGISLINKNTT